MGEPTPRRIQNSSIATWCSLLLTHDSSVIILFYYRRYSRSACYKLYQQGDKCISNFSKRSQIMITMALLWIISRLFLYLESNANFVLFKRLKKFNSTNVKSDINQGIVECNRNDDIQLQIKQKKFTSFNNWKKRHNIIIIFFNKSFLTHSRNSKNSLCIRIVDNGKVIIV